MCDIGKEINYGKYGNRKKYMIKKLPEDLEGYPCKIIEQAYLNTSPVVRVRQSNDSYYLTYKGSGLMAREEYNLPSTRNPTATCSQRPMEISYPRNAMSFPSKIRSLTTAIPRRPRPVSRSSLMSLRRPSRPWSWQRWSFRTLKWQMPLSRPHGLTRM